MLMKAKCLPIGGIAQSPFHQCGQQQPQRSSPRARLWSVVIGLVHDMSDMLRGRLKIVLLYLGCEGQVQLEMHPLCSLRLKAESRLRVSPKEGPRGWRSAFRTAPIMPKFYCTGAALFFTLQHPPTQSRQAGRSSFSQSGLSHFPRSSFGVTTLHLSVLTT